jgi:hypothetical protein
MYLSRPSSQARLGLIPLALGAGCTAALPHAGDWTSGGSRPASPASALRDNLGTSPRDETLRGPSSAPEEALARPCWCCVLCGLTITDREQSILVAGRHIHRCTNPAGLTFVIGCFCQARGCGVVGEPTPEWTWFAGYRWQLALCRQCGLHLGWRYMGADSFYGLILDQLLECGERVS